MTSENSSEDITLILKGEEILKTNDLFKVLGISKSTDEKQIKKAYRKVLTPIFLIKQLALKFHPDKFKHSSGEEVFKKISAAYKILSDPDKRRRYESGTGFDDIFSDGVNRRRTNNYHHFGQGQGFTYYEGEFDPFDIFQQMFGGGMFHQAHMQQRRRAQRQRRYHNHHQQRQRQAQGDNQNAQSGILAMVVIWMVLIFIMGIGGGASDPLYSMNKTRKYSKIRY